MLLSIAPFLFFPGMFDRWVFPKLLVAMVGAGCALAARGTGRLPGWLRWWLLAAGLVLVTSALMGDTPMAQLVGRWPRYEGLVGLPVYVLAMWAGSRLLGGHGATGRLWALWATVACGAVVAAVVATAEASGMHPIATTQARAGSLFGNASDQGIVGVVTVALFLPPAQRVLLGWRGTALARSTGSGRPPAKSWPRAVVWLGLGAGTVLVATSASRAAVLASVVVLIVHAAVRLISPGGRASRAAVWWLPVGVGAVGTMLVVLLPMARNRVSGATALSQDTVVNRFTIWRTTFDLLRGRVVSGVGPSGFEDAINRYLPVDWFATVGEGAVLESPHNVVLQVASAGGVGACALMAGFVAATVISGRHRCRSGAGVDSSACVQLNSDLHEGSMLGLIGWVVALLTHFTSPGNTILPAMLLGGLLAVPAVPASVRPARSSRGAGRSAATNMARDGRAHSPAWWAVLAVVAVWTAGTVGAVAGDYALGRGVTAVSAGRSGEASSAFGLASTLRPWDCDIPLIASESFAAILDQGAEPETSTVDAASDWSQAAVDRLPRSVRALKARAVARQYRGDAAGAIEDLKVAAGYAPTDPQVFQRLGALQAVTGNVEEGLRSVEWAAHLDPGNQNIAQTLGYVQGLTE